MTARYNIVVLGKSGVGKSALINYLYGQEERKTGVGKPVTEKGFHSLDLTINKLPVRIFDSWGIEVGSAKDWEEELENALAERGIDKSPEQWFHTVFYCISAGGSRVEDFEIETIKKFINNNYKVTVIFTKSDQSSDEDLEKIKYSIDSSITKNMAFIPVCSETKKLRSGHETERFGKEEVFRQAYTDFWDSIILRLPQRCVTVLFKEIDTWKEQQMELLEHKIQMKQSLVSINYDLNIKSLEFRNSLNGDEGLILRKLNREIELTIKMYGMFYEVLDSYLQGISELGESIKIETKLGMIKQSNMFDFLGVAFSWKNMNIDIKDYFKVISNELAQMSGNPKTRKEDIIDSLNGFTDDIKDMINRINVTEFLEDIKRKQLRENS